jgi:GAF domain-containing protein/HAMP domain-containing protein
MFKKRYTALSSTERRVLWLLLAISAILGAFSSTLVDTLLGAPNFQYAAVNAVPFVIFALTISSAILLFNGRAAIASWILLLGSLVGFLISSSQAEGFGLPAAFMLLAITLFVPLQLLKGRAAAIAMWTGIAGTVLIILLDSLWSGERVPALQQDVAAAQIATVVLGLILLIAIAVQYQSFAFRTKLIILFVAVSVAAVGAVSVFANNLTQTEVTQQVGRSQVIRAESLAFETGKELESQIESLQSVASQFGEIAAQANSTYGGTNDDIVNQILVLDQRWRTASDRNLLIVGVLNNETAKKLHDFQATSPSQVEIFLTDKYGANIAATERTTDYYQADEDWWKLSYSLGRGKVYIGQPEFDESSQTYSVIMAVPVFYQGKETGILRSTLDVTAILENLRQTNLGRSEEVDLRILGDTLLDGTAIDAGELAGLGSVMGTYGEINYKGQPSFVSQQRVFSSANSASNEAITQLGWSVIVHQDVTSALQPVQQQTRTITLIAVVITILVGLLGFFASQILAAPIITLTDITAKVAEGDLSIRAQIATQDEIGALANTFNRMTSQLQDTLGGLERRIAERTADVELARLLSERRAQDLQAISEVSRTISTEQRLEILLPLVTRLVSERFDFYHVGIFFVDATKQFAILQAANSEGGKRMLARGHRLEVGLTGLVGAVAQTGKPRIALDVGSDATFFDNPDLPATRSEMALPLNFRGETIGVLDVQSVRPGAFTESDANTLSILADQIAIAIENARLFGQTQQARDEAEALYDQFQRTEWKSFTQQETTVGYSQSAIGGKPLAALVETEEIRAALQKGQVVVVDGKNIKAQPAIAIPVKLRGQTIGVLNIKAPTKNRKWNQDEISLAQAISDRLALALDNARLLQESQRRASKEAKIGEVTAKIGASINMRNVLQTAVEELGRALPGSEVVIQFESSEEN